MKKSVLCALLLGAVLAVPGCGFTEGTDAVVTVVVETPTPTPEPTPEVTPTPEPTPTPEAVTEQTTSGIVITVQDGTYTATDDLNMRADAYAEAEFIQGIPSGTVLTSTGVCENGWIRIEYDGKTGFVIGDYVTKNEDAAADTTTEEAVSADTAEVTDGTEG